MAEQKVYVLIEWTGTSSAVDGAIIHGVYTTPEAADAIADDLVTSRKPRGVDFEVQEFVLE